MARYIVYIFWLILLSVFSQLVSANETLTVGVFAVRPKAEMEKQYQELSTHLAKALPKFTFNFAFLSQAELESALSEGELNLVITNPTHFILLRSQSRLSGAIVTMVSRENGINTRALGGVILTLADRNDLNSIEDLRGKRIAISGTNFMGGYQAQVYELMKVRVRVPEEVTLSEVGNHDKVLEALIQNKADVGFVRTGILEAMERQGKISSGQFKVINGHNFPDFPYAVSTQLYPEWPVAVLPNLPEQTVKKIASALWSFTPATTIDQNSSLAGFSVPADYEPVDHLARSLRLPPYDNLPAFELHDVWQKYWQWVIAVAGLCSLLVGALIWLMRTSRRIVEGQQILRLERDLTKLYVDTAQVLIIALDHDNKIVMINRTAQSVLGYSESELLGCDWHSLNILGKKENSRVELGGKNVEEAGGGLISQYEQTVLCKDSSRRIISWKMVPIKGTLGEVTGFIFSGMDVTAEKSLIENLKLYQWMLDSLGDGVYTADKDGICTYINSSALTMLGFNESEIIGKNQHNVFHHHYADGREYPNSACYIGKTLRDGIPRNGEEWFWRKDESGFPIFFVCTPIMKQGAQVGVIVIFQDITERKNHIRALEDAKNEAESAARVKGEFLSTMSHELRTPLNGVIGMTNLLLDTPLNSDQKEFTNTIKLSADALMTVIGDILDFSKFESGGLELENIDFSLRQVVAESVEILTSRAKEKGLVLNGNIELNLPEFLVGDPARIKQILLNFLSNAVKFTLQGEVTVIAKLVNQDETGVQLRLSVIDSGIGLTEAVKERLFKPFSQADSSTSRKYGGTGLGLAICKKLVEAMGGEIGVDSIPGKGSTFWIQSRFAIGKPTEKNSREADNAGVNVSSISEISRKRLLLAEDNRVNQRVAIHILNKLGYSVDVVENGINAVNAIANNSYDLVLMDCQMPEMDGFQATQAIRQTEIISQKHIIVIAMTANALDGDRERCLAAGMDDYMTKPINVDRVKEMLTAWL
jgi:PAS domain S-box-containing protein